jgi:cysteine peptidase C11 family protein
VPQPHETELSSPTAPEKGKDPRWLVMVFMGADGVEGDADLSREADDDIEEMEEVAKKAEKAKKDGEPERLNIFVQLHRKGRVERLHIGHGKRPVDDAQDATNGRALTSFIADSIFASKHHPSEHSMLVLWGHAYRFGIGPQATRHGVDALDFAELASVLRNFQEEHKKKYPQVYADDEKPKLDIVAFDACDLASIEMAYQLYPFAKYLLASQIGIPLPGWPYNKVLDRLQDPKGRVMGPAELGAYIARRFCAKYAADDRMVSLSMLDLQQAPKLFETTEALARRLAIAVSRDPDELQRVHDMFLRSRTPDKRPFVDVAAMCWDIMRNCLDDEAVRAAMKLGDILISPNPTLADEGGGSAIGAGKPFIVENSRNSAETAGLHGVSLYAPHVANNHDWEGASHFYEKFLFAQQTLWSALVHALTLPD